MGWSSEFDTEKEDVQYPKAEYIITASGNKVSRKSVLCGSQNIVLNGKTIIMQGCVLRGDLSNIKLGKYCIVSSGVVIRPPFKKFIVGCAFFPVQLGDFCVIREDTVMNAATVGSFVKFGKNCYIGRRCIIKDCVIIDDNSIVPDGTVMPPFTRWAGAPARVVEELPDSLALVLAESAKEFYDHFKPTGKDLPGWGSALGKLKTVRTLAAFGKAAATKGAPPAAASTGTQAAEPPAAGPPQ